MGSQRIWYFAVIFAQLFCSIYCAIIPPHVNNIIANTTLEKELQIGDVIIIKGEFSEDEYRVNINLENRFNCLWEPMDENRDCTVYEHRIAFDGNEFVTRISKYVADLEPRKYEEFPFKKGQNFTYKITVKEDNFYIEIDSKSFQSFSLVKFRKPLYVKYITIYGTAEGSADINEIIVERGNVTKDQVIEPLTINTETASVYLENDLQPGNVITIEGQFLNDSLTTNIDLENKNCKWRNYRLNSDNPDCLVAFHSSIRFNERKIIRNIFKNGYWQDGGEERHGIFPFENGQNFVFKIIVKENHFEVEIDGDTFTTFNFRVPLTGIKYVKVYGNAVVNSISVDMDVSKLFKFSTDNCVRDVDERSTTSTTTEMTKDIELEVMN